MNEKYRSNASPLFDWHRLHMRNKLIPSRAPPTEYALQADGCSSSWKICKARLELSSICTISSLKKKKPTLHHEIFPENHIRNKQTG